MTTGCAAMGKVTDAVTGGGEVIPPETADTITKVASEGANILSIIAASGGGVAGLGVAGIAIFKLILKYLARKKTKEEEKTAAIAESIRTATKTSK